MCYVLRDTIQTARKHYPCDACEQWKKSGLVKEDVDELSWSAVQSAQADEWKITKGTKYRKVTYCDGGDLMSYRARLDMDMVCQKNIAMTD
jgi:hypothetical protein